MSLPIEKVLEKIAKLRALAAKAGSMAEAEAAIAAASRLADEYRVSEEQIVGVNLNKEEIIDGGVFHFFERRTYWKWLLAVVIMEHFGCAWYQRAHDVTPNDRYDDNKFRTRAPRCTIEHRMHIVGRKDDIVLARYMLSWLMTEVARLCDKEAPSGAYSKAYRSSWATGAVEGIKRQFQAQRDKDKENPMMTAALVRLDTRVTEAEDELKRMFPKMKEGKSFSTTAYNNTGAFARGVEAGSKIHLGQHLGDGDLGGVKALK